MSLVYACVVGFGYVDIPGTSAFLLFVFLLHTLYPFPGPWYPLMNAVQFSCIASNAHIDFIALSAVSFSFFFIILAHTFA